MPAPTPRTTPDLVRGIIDVQSGVDLTPFIASANNITTNVCGPTGTYQSTYTDGYVDSTMELIERWLSAHLYTIFDNQLAAAKAGTVAVRYQYKVDLGLRNSMYGQQVMLLDYDSNLAALENTAEIKKKIVVKIFNMGRPPVRRPWGDINDWEITTTVES